MPKCTHPNCKNEAIGEARGPDTPTVTDGWRDFIEGPKIYFCVEHERDVSSDWRKRLFVPNPPKR